MPIINMEKSTLVILGHGEIAIGIIGHHYSCAPSRQVIITFREVPKAIIGTELSDTVELGAVNLVFDRAESIDILMEQLAAAKEFMEKSS